MDNPIANNQQISFSIILETENLAHVEIESLVKCIESLEGGDLTPEMAKEFIIMNTGQVPDEIRKIVEERFPWAEFIQLDEDYGYYDSKMYGFKKTTGEIIVYCDSDCLYQQNWLEASVKPFLDDSELMVVGGETSVQVKNPLDLAVLLIWIFPPFSYKKTLYKKSSFYLNNVVFRRFLIERFSFVKNVNLYRSDGAVYHKQLVEAGIQIWNNPNAKTLHPRPETFKKVIWRMLLNSHSTVFRHCLNGQTKLEFDKISFITKIKAFFKASKKWIGRPFRRIFNVSRSQIKKRYYIPLAIPLVILFQVVLVIGTLLSLIFPTYIRNRATQILEGS